MTPAMTLCLLSAGGFLLTGMLIGVWKYHGMMTRPDHRAHIYVDRELIHQLCEDGPAKVHASGSRRAKIIEQRCGIALPPLC